MVYLTIRNLSVTPLAVVRVERFDIGRGGVLGGVSNLLWGTARSTSDVGGAMARGRNEISDLRIGPFESRETSILAGNPVRDVLRLTLEGTFDDGGRAGVVHCRYIVDIPGPSPHSIELQPVDHPKSVQASTAAFTAVYSARRAHLAIMSSAVLASWMGTVDGSWPLSALSLPGTHNSPTCYVSLPTVRCQAVDVRTQLDNGVRFLDVRVHVHANGRHRMALVHSAFPVSLAGPTWFTDLHATVCAFLDAHPSETVLMSIKREGTGSGTDGDLARQLLNGFVDQRWFTEPRIPTLDEARGRIVLVRRFHLPKDTAPDKDGGAFCQPDGSRGWGIDGSSWPDNCVEATCGSGHMHLQDYYGVMAVSAISRKIEYTQSQLERAASRHFPRTKAEASAAAAAAASSHPPFYMNFLSGSNFFNSSCWPEKIAAKVNPAVAEYLCIRHGEGAKGPSGMAVGDASTGVVITDWVGLDGNWDLIRCVVAWNARLQMRS